MIKCDGMMAASWKEMERRRKVNDEEDDTPEITET
jgi:hypothetical protein